MDPGEIRFLVSKYNRPIRPLWEETFTTNRWRTGSWFESCFGLSKIDLRTGYYKQKANIPVRIERWRQRRLQPDKATHIKCQSGRFIPVDTMFRHLLPCIAKTTTQGNIDELYVNFIANHAFAKTLTPSEVKCANLTDRSLKSFLNWH